MAPKLATGIELSGPMLSSAFPPFPQKLVARIQAGQFVEMKELLTDNISLQSQLDGLHSQGTAILPMAIRPRLREVGSALV